MWTYNSGKLHMQCQKYLPYAHQEPTFLRNKKCARLNVGNIPHKFIYIKALFSQCKANI